MALFKNVAGQKLAIYAWDMANAAPKTGDSANITAYISKDGGISVQSIDVSPAEINNATLKGIYVFDLDQAETNCDLFVLRAVSSTADIEIGPVVVYTVVLADYMADVSALGLEATNQLIKTETDKIQPDIIAVPEDYKADVSALALEATAQLIKTEADKIQPDIIAVPENYMADVSGLAPANEYNAELAAIQADLDTPDQYKANVASLALEASLQLVKTETDKIQPDIIAVPEDYKADVTLLALEATAQLIKTEVDKIQTGIINVPENYMADISALALQASSLLIKAETDKIQSGIIDVPEDFMADVSALALQATALLIKTETDKISAISANVIDILSDTEFIKNVEGGKWQISGDEMIFYKADNVTEIMRFTITRDAETNPTMRTRQ